MQVDARVASHRIVRGAYAGTTHTQSHACVHDMSHTYVLAYRMHELTNTDEPGTRMGCKCGGKRDQLQISPTGLHHDTHIHMQVLTHTKKNV